MSLGTPEMIVIFVLVLLLFGPKRLPDLARGLGKGLREFKKATGEIQSQLNILGDDDDEPSWRSRRDATHAREKAQREDASKTDTTDHIETRNAASDDATPSDASFHANVSTDAPSGKISDKI